jgi:hypothetical protein
MSSGPKRSPALVAAASLSRLQAGYRRGTAVLLFSCMNWLAEAAVLAAAFELAGRPVPWHGLLLAYTASQLAGSLIPLPGGLGSADGGLLGALTLTGTPLAAAAVAAVIYRLLSYWAVGAAATCVITAMRRRHPSLTSPTPPGGKQQDARDAPTDPAEHPGGTRSDWHNWQKLAYIRSRIQVLLDEENNKTRQ